MARKTAALRMVPTPAKEPAPRVDSPSGAFARLEGQELVIHDAKGAIVVRYDGETGSATIAVPAGDLRLAAPNGKVVVEAGTDLELSAGACTRMASAELDIKAARTRLRSDAVQLLSDAIELTSSNLAVGVGKCHVRAERILERAVDVYREVEGLIETRAGRVRTLVKGATQMSSGSTSIVSKDDTFVDGRRVLLG